MFDERQTAVQFRVQRRQLIHATVKHLLRLAEQLGHEKWRKRHVHHDAFVDRFAQHPADEFEQLQMVLLHVRRRRRIQSLVGRCFEQIERRIEYALDCLF